MYKPGEIISHLEMSVVEQVHLQRGMNYRLHPHYSVILMSLRPNSPYADYVEEDGRVLIYEGHDVTRKNGVDPKIIDQPMRNTSGTLTQNGLFFEAALDYRRGKRDAEIARVYEKLRDGIWVYNGVFELIDAWLETDGIRQVFKFKLQSQPLDASPQLQTDLDHNRFIPSSVKIEVWKRDKGRCVICGDNKNLHYDHIIPFSKGGTSLKSENIQLLCAKHNLQKKDKII